MITNQRLDQPVRYSPDQYEKYTRTHVALYDQMFVARIADELKEARSAIVIDIGTGAAQVLLKIAAALPSSTFHFIGTDLFEDMVAQAEKAVRLSPDSERITIVKDDVHAMCFRDNFCDLIISRSTIHHWRNPIRAFQEICRVLKPGGVALIHDIRRDAPRAVQAAFQHPRRIAEIPPSNFAEKYTPAEIEDFLRAAKIPATWSIHAPAAGPGALGFELRLSKTG